MLKKASKRPHSAKETHKTPNKKNKYYCNGSFFHSTLGEIWAQCIVYLNWAYTECVVYIKMKVA